MRRITVFERDGSWRFASPQGEQEGVHENALDAGNAAREFGETLRGQALGYVIRLEIPYATGSALGVAIDTKVFAGENADSPPRARAKSERKARQES